MRISRFPRRWPDLALAGLDPDAVGIGTLAERLREDAVAHGLVQLLPLMVGAWARKPA